MVIDMRDKTAWMADWGLIRTIAKFHNVSNVDVYSALSTFDYINEDYTPTDYAFSEDLAMQFTNKHGYVSYLWNISRCCKIMATMGYSRN